MNRHKRHSIVCHVVLTRGLNCFCFCIKTYIHSDYSFSNELRFTLIYCSYVYAFKLLFYLFLLTSHHSFSSVSYFHYNMGSNAHLNGQLDFCFFYTIGYATTFISGVSSLYYSQALFYMNAYAFACSFQHFKLSTV